MEPSSTLDPATLQALTWTFGFLLFFVFATAIGFLIKLLSKLSQMTTQHEVRISRAEEDIEGIHEQIFPVNYKRPKK